MLKVWAEWITDRVDRLTGCYYWRHQYSYMERKAQQYEARWRRAIGDVSPTQWIQENF